MTFEKLTSSFTIDDRDETGRRKGVFYSASVTRSGPEGWAAVDAMIAACMLSKHVVAMTYRDAVHRGVVTKQTLGQELPGIIAAYDRSIAKLTSGGEES